MQSNRYMVFFTQGLFLLVFFRLIDMLQAKFSNKPASAQLPTTTQHPPNTHLSKLVNVTPDEEEDDPIPRTDCFFCLHHSATLEKNAIHMSNEHSFFIPDVEYLVDLAGLFEYLGAKVNILIWISIKNSFVSFGIIII